MRSPEDIAEEAVACRKAGDHDGYGYRLRELESHGFNTHERALLLEGKGLDEVLEASTASRSSALTMCD